MALVNGAGALTGVVAPIFVGILTPNVSQSTDLFSITILWILKYFFVNPLVFAWRMEIRFLDNIWIDPSPDRDLFDLGFS